jgi:hypothetical protein
VLTTAPPPEAELIKGLLFSGFNIGCTVNVDSGRLLGAGAMDFDALLEKAPLVSNNVATIHTADWNDHLGCLVELILGGLTASFLLGLRSCSGSEARATQNAYIMPVFFPARNAE